MLKDVDAAENAELAPLKLQRARLATQVEPEAPSADGIDAVSFWVSTKPGTRPGPLMKIASGGELARFMLALAKRGSAPTRWASAWRGWRRGRWR